MVFQLHWQNRENPGETEFIAQASLEPPDRDEKWLINHFLAIIEERRNEIPKGWAPCVCNEKSKMFAWAKETETQAKEA